MAKETVNIPSKSTASIENLRPFKRFVMSLGELPTSYLESMTYAEMIMWLCNYLQEKVIPTVNNNAEAITELQNLYNELHDYVEHYFDNLDVQEEINNKLDNMYESGLFENILMNYTKITKVFDTYDDVLIDDFVSGQKIKTLGYHYINDGGGAEYYITNNQNVKGYKDILNDLYVVLLNTNNVNVKQFGAYGDGIHDDTNAIKDAVTYLNSQAMIFRQEVSENPTWLRYFATNMKLIFPYGTYKINSKIEFINSQYYDIDGNNSIIISDNDNVIFEFTGTGGTKSNISNLLFKEVFNAIKYNLTNTDLSFINIINCKFVGVRNIAIDYNNQSSMLKISNSIFSWCYRIFVNNNGDNVEFENCWFSEYEANENNYYSIKLLHGETKFNNCLFIPNGNYKPSIIQSNYTNLCWIQCGEDNVTLDETGPKVIINQCRLSAESNNKTIINWKVKPSNDTSPSKGAIKITNNYSISSTIGDSLIKMWHLPQQLIIENNDLRIESAAFISFDSSFDIDTELTTYFNFQNRTKFTYDYSIMNNKTQTQTPYNKIPYKLTALFRHIDFDIQIPIEDNIIPLGNIRPASTTPFNQTYLLKCFYNPVNVVPALSTYVGIISFNAINTNASGDSNNYIQVKLTKLVDDTGGSAATVATPTDISVTFDNDSTRLKMEGVNKQISLKLKLNNSNYNKNENYFTLTQLN